MGRWDEDSMKMGPWDRRTMMLERISRYIGAPSGVCSETSHHVCSVPGHPGRLL